MNKSIQKPSTSRLVREVIAIIFGSLISACGIAFFANPARITGGGVTGIGTIMFYTFGFDQGVVMLVANIPIIIAGCLVFGWSYGLKVSFGAVMLSVWVMILGNLTDYQGFLNYADSVNTLLSALIYGVLSGVGSGIALRSGINFGGSTVISQIIAKKTPYSVGAIDLAINSVVLIAGGFFFDLPSLIFAFVALYILTQMMNFVVTSFGTKLAKTAYIFSVNRTPDISRRVLDDLKHGGTVFYGTGIYSSKDRTMLIVVVPNHQMLELVRIVNEEDPAAFVYIAETYQAMGTGFIPLKKAASKK